MMYYVESLSSCIIVITCSCVYLTWIFHTTCRNVAKILSKEERELFVQSAQQQQQQQQQNVIIH